MVRSPVRNSPSAGSMSLVMRSAPSASVRATMTVGTPMTSAASRAEMRFLTACEVGRSTLPPMWPHFFSLASWSSKWTPAAPASIIPFISSKTFKAPAEARLGVGEYRGEPVGAVPVLGVVDLVGPLEGLVDPLDHVRNRVGWIEALVRVHLPGEVGVRC